MLEVGWTVFFVSSPYLLYGKVCLQRLLYCKLKILYTGTREIVIPTWTDMANACIYIKSATFTIKSDTMFPYVKDYKDYINPPPSLVKITYTRVSVGYVTKINFDFADNET